MSQCTVSVFGLGYVGLCTAVSFAQKGINTIGVDIEEEKVKMINQGKAPIFEHGLETALQSSLSQGAFHCTVDPREAILGSDISIIAVGTPSRPDGSIDLQYIQSVSEIIGAVLKEKATYHLIVDKSTVVPGTTLNVIKPLLESCSGKTCGINFGLCTNPEFLQEGNALKGTLNPDRIVIGEYDPLSGKTLEELYRRFHGQEMPPVLKTNLTNAELIKYANNAFLATKISFINMIANICEKTTEADVTVVARGIGLDHRISPHFLEAGLGYGGSCFPKDVKALIAYSNEIHCEPRLLESVEQLNQLQPLKVVDQAKKFLGGLKHKRVALLGLSFKPGTDDMREAVSIKIIQKLLQEQADIAAYDPAAKDNAEKIFGKTITYAPSMQECIRDADCCIIVTEWDEFKSLAPDDLDSMRTRILIDGRRISDPKKFRGKTKYAAIGLGPS